MSKVAELETRDPKHKADEYLRKHHIIELFEDLCTAVCFKQPDNVEAFLVEQLKLKKTQGNMTGIFGPEEIRNVFQLIDLKNSGYISKDQCAEALKSLASSEYQYSNIKDQNADIPDKVDFMTFQKLCSGVLGIKG